MSTGDGGGRDVGSRVGGGDGLGRSWARGLRCSLTGERSGLDHGPGLSPAGAPWLVEYELDAEKGRRLVVALPGRAWTLWRYAELLPVAHPGGRLDLGEGGTPLVRLRQSAPLGVTAWFKDESGNPTGSFKARGLSVAVNRARELGAPGVQLASAGNAALALAAYAAAAGLHCRVAVPADTPPTVAGRCRELGAEVVEGGATLADSARQLPAEDGLWDLSTLREPYRVEGKKTMGLELAEQFAWRLPDWIVYPTGGGTGIVGMHKAFAELRALGLLSSRAPRFAVVQMAGCAPLVEAFDAGRERAEPWPKPDTRVWGLRVPRALGDFLVLRALRETGGTAVAVAEEEVPAIQERLARGEGLRVGPEGAAALAGLHRLAADGLVGAGDRVVVFQTGHPDNYL